MSVSAQPLRPRMRKPSRNRDEFAEPNGVMSCCRSMAGPADDQGVAAAPLRYRAQQGSEGDDRGAAGSSRATRYGS
jgi:hypothetical protein